MEDKTPIVKGMEEPMDISSTASAQDLEDNRLIQNVLLVTVDPRNLGPNGPRSAVNLGASSNETLINLESLENLFFTRILMPGDELPVSLVANQSGKWISLYGKPDQSEVITYLGECFIRLQQAKQSDSKPAAARVFDGLEECIMRHFALGFEEPELLRSSNVAHDLAVFYWTEMNSHEAQVVQLFHKLFGQGLTNFLRQGALAILEMCCAKAQGFGLMKMQDFDAVVHLGEFAYPATCINFAPSCDVVGVADFPILPCIPVV